MDVSEKGGVEMDAGTQSGARSNTRGEVKMESEIASLVKASKSHESPYWMHSFEKFLDYGTTKSVTQRKVFCKVRVKLYVM